MFQDRSFIKTLAEVKSDSDVIKRSCRVFVFVIHPGTEGRADNTLFEDRPPVSGFQKPQGCGTKGLEDARKYAHITFFFLFFSP